ncbi:DUF3761 domain-containing protein [Mycolicibacter heraklionensis]|uniref:DUF3761 domain-containing protein n=1 Tax=Mycolicibacter heraklionensis TaxID=512402 RepID=UPI001F39EBF2|nr:DUF3761 domain-containing protein [Mycolicibacter heraklionensis]
MQTQNDKDGGTGMGPTIVRVAHRSLTKPVTDDGPEDLCHWPFNEPPVPGQWVIAPTSAQAESYAVVAGLGKADDAKGAALKTITKVVPEEDVAEALRKAKAETMAWLWLAQRTAGFPAPGYPAPPDEYPYSPIPPSRGTAPSADVASEYGLVWRRVHRQAQECGLPDEQLKRFKSISEQWFALSQSLLAEQAQRPVSANAPAEKDITEAADAPTKRSVPKWLWALAAVVVAVVVIVVLVRVVGAKTGESSGTPPTSHPTTSQPSAFPSAPAGANAQCRDGTYSFSTRRNGSCAGHGGVAAWLDSQP